LIECHGGGAASVENAGHAGSGGGRFAERSLRHDHRNHLPLLADTTQRTYDQWLRLYIEPAFHGRQMCDIGPLDVQAFLVGLPVSPGTKASIRGILASVWTQAERWGYATERNPVDGVRRR